MKPKFTARKPKPKPGAVTPLQESAEKAARADRSEDKPAGSAAAKPEKRPKELGGPSGPEPTRYGDWERKGICVDF